MKEVTVEKTARGPRVRVRTINEEKSRTQQQFAEQCDINNIIRKYQKTGEITHRARSQGVYADVSQITDYHTMVNRVADAQAAFLTLNAEVRRRFNDDPGALIRFLQDENNREEAVKLGLISKTDLPTINDELNDDKKATGSKKMSKSDASKQGSTPPPAE